MNPVKQNLLYAVFLIAVLYVIGAFFYHGFEGWSFLDSVYFMTTTFTTVGYGDITPKTSAGKIFTIFVYWIGISTGFYLLYSLSKYREQVFDDKMRQRLGVPPASGKGPRLPFELD